MVQEEIRKGPWTEQEDLQLVYFVGLFGDRRWDFIAKVSGLNRTGKSCRLRWVNYLNPGLKRGKMTPREERLVLELHSKWGNRWSRIARKLPGRTDNEIKNYWRTHMRKKAQERKRTLSPSSSTSSSSNNLTEGSQPFASSGAKSLYDTGGVRTSALVKNKFEEEELSLRDYSMDDIWKDIDFSEENTIKPAHQGFGEESCSIYFPAMASPTWEYCPEPLWRTDNPSISDHFSPFYAHEGKFLTG